MVALSHLLANLLLELAKKNALHPVGDSLGALHEVHDGRKREVRTVTQILFGHSGEPLALKARHAAQSAQVRRRVPCERQVGHRLVAELALANDPEPLGPRRELLL